MDGLAVSHPAVRTWFARRFPEGPTDPQREGWPAIARGGAVLIAAPTGSGKTLAAFLLCIDRLMSAAAAGALPEGTEVVYVSPLRALAADITQNLETPLAEIRAIAMELGLPAPELRVQVRTGDTPASSRAAMTRRPPHILVTTPESLYLLLTAEKGRAALGGVRTVIVDEIHALARDKRGSHLALTLERLAALGARPPQRIGLSATQRPVQTMARLLVGAGPGRSAADGAPACAIVDIGHRRPLDLAIELPGSELGAVISHEQWAEILDRIAAHVAAHRTVLVFVNTRRLAERLAHLLGERAGHDRVAAHHGSLSRERRLALEGRLRAGDLRALVATASLELGIDIGPVELVCQVGSPRSIATFLQRVGRSGHARGATARGRLYPTTRDELVECAALLAAVRAGELDAVTPPVAPLDVLAQQLVAACAAATPWTEDDLYALVRRAAPYADLPRADFDAVVDMLTDGIATGHGRRGAYLHRDRVNGTLRGRRGARISALTSGGAIPETADYRVVADPDDTMVGTVNEDWAIESMAGDIFLLGSTSWRIRRVEPGTVRVVDAAGAPPSVPFWLGEAPGRTAELSAAVSELRARAGELIADGRVGEAVEHVQAAAGIAAETAAEIVRYLAAGRAALGALPTRHTLVFERFFDETGGMQLVVHAPFGARVNRALGLLLRKRFCRRFDFELQAAASDDAVLLSLGPRQSLPLAELRHFLSARALRETLSQAALGSPMWQARWRWNLGRALLVLRRRGGRRNPPPVQRMEADDLMVAVFPGLAACQENMTGPVEIPDHPMVRQTMHDCLHEAMDVDGLEALLDGIASGAVATIARESTEPSPLAHEILNGRPYTFLDDAPLEERRSRAVALRRGLPAAALDLGRLDPEAIARVRAEARTDPRDADELHQALLDLVVVRSEPEWSGWLEELARAGRAAALGTAAGAFWVAAESLALADALFPGAALAPEIRLPGALAARPRPEPEAAAAAVIRGHLGCVGPCTPAALAERTGLTRGLVEIALARLEAEGVLLRGRFERADAGDGASEVCDRRLLARIHRYTQDRLRRGIEPVTAQDLMRFLLGWQHVAPGTQLEGRQGLLAAIEQLQGFEVAAGAWEDTVLAARVAEYRPEWLDDLCLSGAVAWARLAPRGGEPAPPATAARSATPASRATPIAVLVRDNLSWLLAAARGGQAPAPPDQGAGRDVLDCLARRGALFLGDLVAATGRARAEVEEGLWELVARGLVTADGFASIRSLLRPRESRVRRAAAGPGRGLLRRRADPRPGAEGRWAVLGTADTEDAVDLETLGEAVAEQLLIRYGVVFRDVIAREILALPWREVLRALRRLEARGAVRGGRFVTGFTGEQFALPEAVEALRRTRARERTGHIVRVSAVDPLNLVGILTPGPRIPAVRGNVVVYRDGCPITDEVVTSCDGPLGPHPLGRNKAPA